MIGRIQGKLLEISDNLLLIDVGGVAYEVEATSAALAAAAAPGVDVTLFTHFVVREDAQLLYGFGSKTERDVFRDLIRISGVGPKMALAIVSGLTLEALSEAVRANDVGLLTRVQGVGKKTAERLLVELKGPARQSPRGGEAGLRRRRSGCGAGSGGCADLARLPTGGSTTGGGCSGGRAGHGQRRGRLLRAALKQIARQAETGTARSELR